MFPFYNKCLKYLVKEAKPVTRLLVLAKNDARRVRYEIKKQWRAPLVNERVEGHHLQVQVSLVLLTRQKRLVMRTSFVSCLITTQY